MKGRLTINEDVILDTSLDVSGNTSVYTFESSGDTAIATDGGTINFGAPLSVPATTTIYGTLNVEELATLSGGITTPADSSVTIGGSLVTSTLHVSSNASITGYVNLSSIGSTTTVRGSLVVDGLTEMEGLSLNGTATLNNLSISNGGLINMGNNKITNVANPLGNQDVATKAYVDGLASGLNIKEACKVVYNGAFTMASTATNQTIVLSDGEGGFNATNDTYIVDGISLSEGDRVLIKD